MCRYYGDSAGTYLALPVATRYSADVVTGQHNGPARNRLAGANPSRQFVFVISLASLASLKGDSNCYAGSTKSPFRGRAKGWDRSLYRGPGALSVQMVLGTRFRFHGVGSSSSISDLIAESVARPAISAKAAR